MGAIQRKFYIQLFFLLFIQLFVADYLNQWVGLLFYFQILALIWLPLSYNFMQALPPVLGFAAILDLFNHTWGLNLIACTFALYGRTFIVPFFIEKDDNETKAFHVATVGVRVFSYYALLLSVLFYGCIMVVEFFGNFVSFSWLSRWFWSVFAMTLLSIVIDYLLLRPKR